MHGGNKEGERKLGREMKQIEAATALDMSLCRLHCGSSCNGPCWGADISDDITSLTNKKEVEGNVYTQYQRGGVRII